MEEQRQALADRADLQAMLSLIIGRLEDFARTVHSRLAALDWTGRRDLIRTLVKRVEIGPEEVTVVFRVAPTPPGSEPPGSPADPAGGAHPLQGCGRRESPFAPLQGSPARREPCELMRAVKAQ